jgi:hypothetical protein
MNRHTNLLLQEMSERMDNTLMSLRQSTPLESYLRGMCDILESQHGVTKEMAEDAVKSAVASLIHEGLVSRIAPLASGSEQADWIETAHVHGVFGRALVNAGVEGQE